MLTFLMTINAVKLHIKLPENGWPVLCTFPVQGKMRAAIGKANLLTTKKFRQFRQLCNENLVRRIFRGR